MIRYLPLAACTIAAAFAAGAGAQELRPGLYRQETVVNMPGAPARPQASQECVTKKDIDDGLVRLGQDKDDPCKASDVKRGPGRVSYRMACEDSTAQVEGTYTVDSYEFTINSAPRGGGGRTVRAVTRGKRTGDCK
jgi:hypothetical protein